MIRQDLVELLKVREGLVPSAHDTNALKDIVVDHNDDNDKATNTISITGPGDAPPP